MGDPLIERLLQAAKAWRREHTGTDNDDPTSQLHACEELARAVDALGAIAPTPATACLDCRGSREVAYQWGPAIDDWEMRPCSRCVPERCASCGGPNPHHVPAPRQVRYIKQGETIEEVTLIGHAPVKDGKFNPWLVIIERADGSRWRVPEMSLYRSHAGIERVPPKNWLTYEGQPEVVSSGSAPVSACFIPGDRGLSDGGVP